MPPACLVLSVTPGSLNLPHSGQPNSAGANRPGGAKTYHSLTARGLSPSARGASLAALLLLVFSPRSTEQPLSGWQSILAETVLRGVKSFARSADKNPSGEGPVKDLSAGQMTNLPRKSLRAMSVPTRVL
jgi:hypothetical protein